MSLTPWEKKVVVVVEERVARLEAGRRRLARPVEEEWRRWVEEGTEKRRRQRSADLLSLLKERSEQEEMEREEERVLTRKQREADWRSAEVGRHFSLLLAAFAAARRRYVHLSVACSAPFGRMGALMVIYLFSHTAPRASAYPLVVQCPFFPTLSLSKFPLSPPHSLHLLSRVRAQQQTVYICIIHE